MVHFCRFGISHFFRWKVFVHSGVGQIICARAVMGVTPQSLLFPFPSLLFSSLLFIFLLPPRLPSHWHTQGRVECTHRGVLNGHTGKEGVIANSAYQKITHVELSLGSRGLPKKRKNLTIFKFENRSRKNMFPIPPIIRLPDESVELQLSSGKLRKEQATGWFGLSFAPKPKYNDRFARQNRDSTRA